ncbi:MAG: hypothetical protein BHW19_11890 [Eubacterium sp. 38_16]|nr:MAG: hypothetical protein BHW19_11890 [Eubacterium sp. 38_16]
MGKRQTKKETIPYPICSVVAVLKMLVRILSTLRSRIWDMVFFLFFCVLAPEGMNELNIYHILLVFDLKFYIKILFSLESYI